MHLSDSEISTIVKPFLAVRDAMDNSPENKQIKEMVDECMKILFSKDPTGGTPLGGSASKTKSLFEMFHLTNRLD